MKLFLISPSYWGTPDGSGYVAISPSFGRVEKAGVIEPFLILSPCCPPPVGRGYVATPHSFGHLEKAHVM